MSPYRGYCRDELAKNCHDPVCESTLGIGDSRIYGEVIGNRYRDFSYVRIAGTAVHIGYRYGELGGHADNCLSRVYFRGVAVCCICAGIAGFSIAIAAVGIAVACAGICAIRGISIGSICRIISFIIAGAV